ASGWHGHFLEKQAVSPLVCSSNLSSRKKKSCRKVALIDNAQDIAFLHDEQFLTVKFDLGTGIFGEQHLIANLDIHLDPLAIVITTTSTSGQNFPLLWFFFCCFR